jgi:hypothetical protein
MPLYKLYSQALGEATQAVMATLAGMTIRLKQRELNVDSKPLLQGVCGASQSRPLATAAPLRGSRAAALLAPLLARPTRAPHHISTHTRARRRPRAAPSAAPPQ